MSENTTTRVVGDITVSLDGFVTAAGADVEHGLGIDGEDLHAWVFDDDPVNREILRRATERSGAVLMGRHLFDVIDSPQGWSDEMGYGADQAGSPPFFVVTGTPPESVRLGLDFTFVADPAAAVEQARAVAGDKDVVVMGGGALVGSCLEAGLLTHLSLHVSPLTFGAGTPLYDGVGRHTLRQVEVEVSSSAVHVLYEVVG